MRERPILYTPENAQKVHEGTKTQTRRIIKDMNPTLAVSNPTAMQVMHALTCPYGTVGDRLCVREAFQLWREGWDRTGHAVYKGGLCDCDGNTFEADELGPWTPSIYMPRIHCRTVLELTGVRVERLQEITDDDKMAEGMDADTCMRGRHDQWVELWESIHGPGSWDLNPWVWVLSFQKVKKEVPQR